MASAGKKDAVLGMKPHSRGSIGAKWMDETQCPDEVDPRMGLMCRTELQVAIKEGNAKRDSFFVVQIGKSSLAAPYQLPIPSDFAKYHKKLIEEDITLEAPSGQTWPVVIRARWTTIRIGRGWRQFVCENGLREGHQLLFTLVGKKHFIVQFFDSSSHKVTTFLPPTSTSAPSPSPELCPPLSNHAPHHSHISQGFQWIEVTPKENLPQQQLPSLQHAERESGSGRLGQDEAEAQAQAQTPGKGDGGDDEVPPRISSGFGANMVQTEEETMANTLPQMQSLPNAHAHGHPPGRFRTKGAMSFEEARNILGKCFNKIPCPEPGPKAMPPLPGVRNFREEGLAPPPPPAMESACAQFPPKLVSYKEEVKDNGVTFLILDSDGEDVPLRAPDTEIATGKTVGGTQEGIGHNDNSGGLGLGLGGSNNGKKDLASAGVEEVILLPPPPFDDAVDEVEAATPVKESPKLVPVTRSASVENAQMRGGNVGLYTSTVPANRLRGKAQRHTRFSQAEEEDDDDEGDDDDEDDDDDDDWEEVEEEVEELPPRRPSSSSSSLERKRAVTEAQRCACGLKNINFLVVMGDAQVYQEFQLAVPLEFMRLTGTLRSKMVKVSLVDVESQHFWDADWRWLNQNQTAHLSAEGWAQFVRDHGLEAGDVCVFELVDTTDSLLFLVHIFRVNPPRTAPTRFSSPVNLRDWSSSTPHEGRRKSSMMGLTIREQIEMDGVGKRPGIDFQGRLPKKPKHQNIYHTPAPDCSHFSEKAPRLQPWTKMFHSSSRDVPRKRGRPRRTST